MNATDRQRAQIDEDLESKYEIFDELGGGGMGRVLRARHRQLKRWVAIKLLHTDLTASEAVSRFLREARAAAHIRSPHVAHVMDAGILRNGHPYIVMEYLQGQDLARLVATRGRLPVEQAVGFTIQALDALAEAHSLQIIHRDIKPGNLFATRVAGGDITIKVVDFGLAKTNLAFDTLDPTVTERGAVMGTPSYMSPEQFVDAQDVDARADIWAIGATLFELVTGAPPFTGSNLPQVYTAVMHQPIPSMRTLVADVPEALDLVVSKCLTRDRTGRYANVAELAEALAPFGRGTAARERVDRIRRVVDGVRESIDLIDVPEGDFDATSELVDRQQNGMSVSAVARSSAAARTSDPIERQRVSWRKYAVILLAASVIALTAAAWQRNAAPSETHETRREAATTSVRAQEQAVVPEAAAGPQPRADVAPVTEATVTSTTPNPVAPAANVSRPTAKKPKRLKVASSAPPKPVNPNIYEQYP